MKKNRVFAILISFISLCMSCTEEENHKHVLIKPSGEDGKDAVFSLIVPNNNYGTSKDIHLYAWTQSGVLNVNRVAIEFDLSQISKGARIDSAFLSLYFNNTSAYGSSHSGQTDFRIQRITSPWDESTINWSNQPTTTLINQVEVGGALTVDQDFKNINITQLIKDIVDNKQTSHGLLLKLVNEEPYRVLYFASSDHENPALLPSLEIYYTEK